MKKNYIYNNYCLMKDGTTPLASFVYSEDNYDAMLSKYYQDLASANANENVLLTCASIISIQDVQNAMGFQNGVQPFVVKSDGFNRIPFEKPEEPES